MSVTIETSITHLPRLQPTIQTLTCRLIKTTQNTRGASKMKAKPRGSPRLSPRAENKESSTVHPLSPDYLLYTVDRDRNIPREEREREDLIWGFD